MKPNIKKAVKVMRLFLPFVLSPIFIGGATFKSSMNEEPPVNTTGTAFLNQIERNLWDMEHAKTQWAMENRKSDYDVIEIHALAEYFPLKQFPDHVIGEFYLFNSVGDLVSAHVGIPLNGKSGVFTVTSF